MPDINDSNNEAEIITVQDHLLKNIRAALTLILKKNAANL